MVNKKAALPGVILEWMDKVGAAADELDAQRAATAAAEDRFKGVVREAFAAGLTADPIATAGRISQSRAYQILGRTRGHGLQGEEAGSRTPHEVNYSWPDGHALSTKKGRKR